MCAIMYLEIPPDPHNRMYIFMLGITIPQWNKTKQSRATHNNKGEFCLHNVELIIQDIKENMQFDSMYTNLKQAKLNNNVKDSYIGGK